MIVAGELDHQVAPARSTRQAHCGHGRLGTSRDQADAVEQPGAVHRGALAQEFGELRLAGRGSAEGESAGRGLLHRLHDVGVRVAEQRGTPRADQVHVLAALDIRDVRATGRHEEPRCASDGAERADRRVDAAGDDRASARELGLVAHARFPSRISRAASTAQYVRIASAPARRIATSDSSTARSRSIQPFALAASIIEYSPLT